MLRRIFPGLPKLGINSRILFSSVVNSRGFSSSDAADDRNDEHKRRKIIQVELTYKKDEGQLVPDVEYVKESDMKLLVGLSSTQRGKYYNFLYEDQNHTSNEQIKKDIRKMMTEANQLRRANEMAAEKHIIYGLGHNAVLPKIFQRTMDKWRNRAMFRNLKLGSQIIYDCGFEKHMSPHEIKNTANQMTIAFGLNRKHKKPFYFYFTNMNKSGPLYAQLLKNMPTIESPGFPITVTEEMFPARIPTEQLVYLTPDSPNSLTHFNHDDTYIIGGIVDRGEERPLVLAKAKEHGIRTARLPLERMTTRFSKSKCLTLDRMILIMLELKMHGQIGVAQKWIPPRKLQP